MAEPSSTRTPEFWLTYRAFANDSDHSDVVRLVDEARAAVVADTAQRASAAGFGPVRVLSTVDLPGLEVERTDPDQTIGDIVAAAANSSPGPVCYAGSGMPAITADDWTHVLTSIVNGQTVTNRMFSSDWLATSDGRVLRSLAGEIVDNRFAVLLRDRCGLEVSSFERSARSLLDLDTPTDAAVLAACCDVGSLPIGPQLRSCLALWNGLLNPAVSRAVHVFETMTQRSAELMICGRVSGDDWARVDRDTSCRVRVLSEERGLRARDSSARSIMGELYASLGVDAFVDRLGTFADAMIWDTRPFYSHLGWRPTRDDRFWADIGEWRQIASPPLRELAARLDEMQVLIGGHSLVAGGLRAGIDQAWTRRELQA